MPDCLMQTFPKYRELGLSIRSDPLPLRCLLPYQHNDIPIWGDLSPEILVPEVRAAIDAATRAREMLAGVPADVFWALEGALFNAVDDSPRVSPQTWEDVAACPEQYTLLEVLVTALYGTAQTRSLAAALPEVDHSGGWRLCLHCGCASQDDEYIEWDNQRLCPYGWGGHVGRDTWGRKYARMVNPGLPEVSRKWVTYPTIQR
jgi:hypothetical protein